MDTIEVTIEVIEEDIEVIEEDIEFGRRNCAYACPVARAGNRILKGVSVGQTKICASFPDGKRRWARLPLEAAQQINRFDNKRGMKPFAFTALFSEEGT